MRLRILFALVLLALAVAAVAAFSFAKPGSRATANVARVIDGDTVELATGEKVRLLGIDGPEKGNYYYYPSRERLQELIGGKTVFLEKDVTGADSFGRLLRYIFLDDEFINLKMVEEGYAFAYVVSPDEKYLKELLAAEERARQQQLVIWESSPESGCVEAKIHYNAAGDDTTNLNDEYIVFKNRCGNDIDLDGWLVKDQQMNNHTFSCVLLSGRTLTLRSGKGTDSNSEVFWNSDVPIWNNDGDTLYLRDAEGKMVLKQSYGKS